MTPEQYKSAIALLGMTQEAFGVWLGLSPRTGQNYAIQGPPLTVSKLLRLMAHCGMTARDVDEIPS